MAGQEDMADWRDVEQGASEIARLGMARLNAIPVAMLGTVRPDGSARISPVEPYIVNGPFLVGAMTWSKKASDPAARSALCAAQRGDGPRQWRG